MTITKHKDSHVDHSLTEAQLAYILGLNAKENELTIQTVELPEDLGTVPCGLVGPAMGDAPVTSDQVTLKNRGERPYKSRLIAQAPRQTRMVTVISGPHDGNPCVLFTAFGGPVTPKEPGDLSIKSDSERLESEQFWSEHALCE
jgi:hypothetical protein